MLPYEDGLREPIADIRERQTGVAIERPINERRLVAIAWNRFSFPKVLVIGNPPPRLMNARVGDIVGVRQKNPRTEKGWITRTVGRRIVVAFHLKTIAPPRGRRTKEDGQFRPGEGSVLRPPTGKFKSEL